jgi:hypothetical protein
LPLWDRLPWVRTRAARRTVAAVGVASALLALTIGLAALTGIGERSAPPSPPVAAATPSQQTAASPARAQAAGVDQPSPTPAAIAPRAVTAATAATARPAQAHASRALAASPAASSGAASSDPGGSGTGRSGVPPGLSRHQPGQLPSPPQ